MFKDYIPCGYCFPLESQCIAWGNLAPLASLKKVIIREGAIPVQHMEQTVANFSADKRVKIVYLLCERRYCISSECQTYRDNKKD